MVEAEIVFLVKDMVDLLSVKIVTGLENVAHVKVRRNVKNAKVLDILLMSFNLYGINNKGRILVNSGDAPLLSHWRIFFLLIITVVL